MKSQRTPFRHTTHMGQTMSITSKDPPPHAVYYENRSHAGLLPRGFVARAIPSGGKKPTTIFRSIDKKTEICVFRLKQGICSERLLNTDGDQVWFIHEGAGMCETMLGRICFEAPAHLFVPRCHVYRIRPTRETTMVGMENVGPIECDAMGKTRDSTPPDWCDVKIPLIDNPPTPDKADQKLYRGTADPTPIWKVLVKRAGIWSYLLYSQTPFSCVEYHGSPYPFVLKIHCSRAQENFPARASDGSLVTFAAFDGSRDTPSAAISTFLPSTPLPSAYFRVHMSDEVLFISNRNCTYEGEKLREGDIAFHPQGTPHGALSHALRAWERACAPDALHDVKMLGVLFECRSPLMATERVTVASEIPDYWRL